MEPEPFDDVEAGLMMDGFEDEIRWWYPRQALRNTNWLHRTDALRVRDLRTLQMLQYQAQSFLDMATQWVVFLHGIYGFMNLMCRQGRQALFEQARGLFQITLVLCQVVYSEGYCFFLDFMELAHYPSSNRTPEESSNRYFEEQYLTIDSLTENEAHEFTGFTKRHLHRLFLHWRLPETITYPLRATFTGEQCIIRYLYHIRTGATKLQMARVFGGDPRKFTYVLRLMTDHLYANFYHKVSGNSMGMWRNHIRDFRYAIWNRLRSGATQKNKGNNKRRTDSSTNHVGPAARF
jgi:hypothetical protein